MNPQRSKTLTLFLIIALLAACSDTGEKTDPEGVTPTPTTAPQFTPQPVATSFQTEAIPSVTDTFSPTPIAAGEVYYVAADEPGASDSNNGLYPTHQGGEEGPWLTIQHAADTLSAGDIVYVREGIYYEVGISFAQSGAPGAPITLANYMGEAPIIDGSQSTDEIPGIWISAGTSHYVIQGLTIRNMGWSGIATDEETAEEAAGLVRSVLEPADTLALLAVMRSDPVGVPDAALAPLWDAGLPAAAAVLDGKDGDAMVRAREVVARAAAATGDIRRC